MVFSTRDSRQEGVQHLHGLQKHLIQNKYLLSLEDSLDPQRVKRRDCPSCGSAAQPSPEWNFRDYFPEALVPFPALLPCLGGFLLKHFVLLNFVINLMLQPRGWRPCPIHHLLNRLCLPHTGMGWLLVSLFCSTDLYACTYASTRLFSLQRLCSIVRYQVLWSLQLCSSFSRLLRLFSFFFWFHINLCKDVLDTLLFILFAENWGCAFSSLRSM